LVEANGVAGIGQSFSALKNPENELETTAIALQWPIYML
jgi:hypothetical protein